MKKYLLIMSAIGAVGMATHAATLASWTFEEGTVGQKGVGELIAAHPYTDVSGSGNDLGVWVASQHPTYVAAPGGNTAVSFNSYVATRPAIMTDTTQPLDSYDFTGSGWTVECTFKPYEISRGWQTVMGKMGNPNPGSGNMAPRLRFLSRVSDGHFEGGFWDSNNDWQWLQSIMPMVNGTWYSVALVYDDAADTCSLWMSTDGGPYELQGSIAHAAGASLVHGVDVRDDGTTVFDPEWKLGAGMWNGNWDTDYFFGEIAEARVSSGALTPDQFISPVQDRVMILSDNFSNLHGGDQPSDWDLLCRQSGSATPNWFSPAGVLTTDGWLKVTNAIVHTGAIALSDYSFNISLEGTFNPAVGPEAATTVVTLQGLPGEANGVVWQDSPISAVIWKHGWIHLYAGDLDAGITLHANLDPGTISALIGETYAPSNDVYTYEFEVLADSETNGTWGFSINGVTLTNGLPYKFEEARERVLAWWPNSSETSWDNLEISHPAFDEASFVDSFDTTDTTNLNQDVVVRQAAGDISMAYDIADNGNLDMRWKIENGAFCAPALFDTNAAGNASWGFGDYNFASDVVGKDFELSFDVTVDCHEDGVGGLGGWAAIYLLDSSMSMWGADSDFGIHVRGTNAGTHAVYYANDAATGDPANHIIGVSVPMVDQSATRHIQMISYAAAGPGGSNLVDVVVDGAVVASNLVYKFADDTVRKLHYNNGLTDENGGGIYFDNLKIRTLATGDTAYELWVNGKGMGGPDAAVDADWDLDGYNNFEEFAFMGDPEVADNPDPIVSYVVGGGFQTMTYFRRNDLAPKYEVFYSTTAVGTWDAEIGPESPLGAPYVDYAATITPVDGEYDQVDVTADTTASIFFLEVKATDR